MNIRYKILFSIDMLNDFYSDNRCMDFDFVPSPETALLLKRYRLIFKVIANKLVILTKVDNTSVPVTAINEETKFVFYLKLKKPVFINFSSIDMDVLRNKRFYFTNLSQNKSNSYLNITGKIDTYDNTRPYKPGAFVNNGAGTIFECVRSTTGNNTATDFWISRGSNQFASVSDMIEPLTKIINYTASAINTIFNINIYSLNKATGDYSELVKNEIQKFTIAVKDVQIDLTRIKNGKYRITVNGTEMFLYIDDQFFHENYLGLIEIFSHLSNTSEFAFFSKIAQYNAATSYTPGDLTDDGTGKIFESIRDTTGNATSDSNFWKERKDVPGKLRELNYSIRFANRLAIWRYRAKTNDITAIEDTSLTYEFTNPVPLEFISKRPIPLSETPIKTLLLKSVKLDKIKPLANPNADRLNTIKKNGDNLFCAEVNLIY